MMERHDPNRNSPVATSCDRLDDQPSSVPQITHSGLRVIVHTPSTFSTSPYRLVRDGDQPVQWANQFLDAQHMRGLSRCSLRAYAYDLLNLQRWFVTASVQLSQLNQSMLIDYIRFQLDYHPKPAAQTINHRISVTYCLYRFHYGQEIPLQGTSPESGNIKPSPFGWGRTRRVLQRIRVKIPRQVVIPLTAAEVAKFWSSFRTFRDLSLVALMLFNGLRSREALNLKIEDLRLPQSEMLILGKGNRQRLLPLDPKTIQLIDSYLRLERPPSKSPFLFLVLKGPNRGSPLTPAGLRTIFRHHRHRTTVLKANPHRFRHTFGADMVRAGISLPALMRLMGHSHIHTTMLYVQLSPQDVWREFQRAVQSRNRPQLPEDL
jgi:integrase/recombinase XerD